VVAGLGWVKFADRRSVRVVIVAAGAGRWIGTPLDAALAITALAVLALVTVWQRRRALRNWRRDNPNL
jgi:hypothetical protein